MKTEIFNPPKVKEKNYPYLGYRNIGNEECIVLFQKKNSGTCIAATWEIFHWVGAHVDDESLYEYFEGDVVLRNS